MAGDKLPLDLTSAGYRLFLNEAEKKGYSGTMTMTREEPIRVIKGIGSEVFDREGRVLTLEFQNFFAVNTYFPNSRRGLERLDYKIEFDAQFQRWAKELERKKPLIICGDFNVAHREIDIARPAENRNNAGFTVEERTWMDNFLNEGFIDSFRLLHEKEVKYSWWSYRFNARKKNIGWRIDYFIVTTDIVNKVLGSDIMSDVDGSDHAPIVLNLKL